MKKYYSNEDATKANSVDIVELLIANGEKIKQTSGFYTTEKHDSLRIRGSTFVWYSRNIYGHTIEFVKEFYNLSFYDAVDFILKGNTSIVNADFNVDNNITSVKSESNKGVEKIDETTSKSRVIAYLCNTRGISYKTVKFLLKIGVLSQDNFGNAVFKAYDENKRFVGGELRVCSDKSNYRRIIGGTIPGYGFNIYIGTPQNAYFFEAAIDMISFYDIYKNRLQNCVLMSMGGLKKVVIDKTIERYHLEYENICLCVDNDKAGNDFVKKIRSSHNDVKFIKLKGCKDWNEFLLSKRNKNTNEER